MKASVYFHCVRNCVSSAVILAQAEVMMISTSTILGSIGHTSLVELRKVVPAGSARVVVKLEGANATGNMKDRGSSRSGISGPRRYRCNDHDRFRASIFEHRSI